MADFDLDPSGFNPLSTAKPPQDGIYDPLDHLDTGHLLQTTANLRPVEGSVPQARKDSQIEAALAKLALPHLNPDALSVVSTIDLSFRGNHALSRSRLGD
jgi:hypothetical protein